MSDRGAGVLAERLLDLFGDRGDLVKATKDHARIAKRILGEHGLFIPDVTAHEPNNDGDCALRCRCGWEAADYPGVSYFDHLNP
jgi:hypothetical protein